MVKDNEQHQAEFSRPVAADRIGDGGIVEEIAASEAERAALAERFEWISMRHLAATVRLRRLTPDLIRVSGRYEAELEQSCVVTLKPVPARVEGEFSTFYAEDSAGEEEGVVTLSPSEEDPPEPIVAGKIDIGETVVQQLAVTLDPYPRAPDAALPEALSDAAGASAQDDADDDREAGPFSVLAKLKRRR